MWCWWHCLFVDWHYQGPGKGLCSTSTQIHPASLILRCEYVLFEFNYIDIWTHNIKLSQREWHASWYPCWLKIPCTLCRLPTLQFPKHPQIFAFPLSCFTDGVKQAFMLFWWALSSVLCVPSKEHTVLMLNLSLILT